MKLKNARIRMFRNILDSTEVKIEGNVTCLVGKNESGKSAFLNALWRLKPARTKPEFVIHDHYPAWLEKRHRNEGVNQKAFEPVEVCLEWAPADVTAMEKKFGPGVVAAGTELRRWKNYSNNLRWERGCDERQAGCSTSITGRRRDPVPIGFRHMTGYHSRRGTCQGGGT